MKRMIGKNTNKLRYDNFQNNKSNKPNNSNSYKPVRIINSKKLINSNLKKFENFSNFYNNKFPLGFSNRTTQFSYIKSNSNINKNYSNNISKSVQTNKFPSKKKRISIIKKNNINFNIQTLPNLWNKLHFFKDEQIKMNSLNTSNSDVNDKKKNQQNVIQKLPINNIINSNFRYFQRDLNQNSNNNNNNTNYSSFATFEKFINKEKEDKKENKNNEKESEFLNYNLGHMKNFSELSININNNENKQFEEKEINLNDLCSFYQNNKDISIIENKNNDEQSFYYNDTNEMKEGEDIHKIYCISMHNN